MQRPSGKQLAGATQCSLKCNSSRNRTSTAARQPQSQPFRTMPTYSDFDPYTDEQRLRADQPPTLFRFAKFGLIHGYCRCLYTSADTCDKSRDHQMWYRICGRLEDSSDDDPYHCYPHRKSPSCLLAEEESENAPSKTTQIVYGDDDTFKSRRRVIKRV